MRLGKVFPRMRNGHTDDRVVVYVLQGDGPHAGHIRTIRFAKNAIPEHLLNVQWTKNGGGDDVAAHVDVQFSFKERGWAMLADVYEAESRLEDYDVWLDFQSAVERGIVTSSDEFPEELFPSRVLELRKKSVAASRWKPPVKEKKSSAKAQLAKSLPADD